MGVFANFHAFWGVLFFSLVALCTTIYKNLHSILSSLAFILGIIVCFWGWVDHAFYNCGLVHKSFSAFYGEVSRVSQLRGKAYGVATNIFCRSSDN